MYHYARYFACLLSLYIDLVLFFYSDQIVLIVLLCLCINHTWCCFRFEELTDVKIADEEEAGAAANSSRRVAWQNTLALGQGIRVDFRGLTNQESESESRFTFWFSQLL